jgi:hypothetical protein
MFWASLRVHSQDREDILAILAEGMSAAAFSNDWSHHHFLSKKGAMLLPASLRKAAISAVT